MVRLLLHLFQSGFLLFIFLLWLLWPKLPKLCWIVVVSGHHCLVPDFRGNAFKFSPLRIMFAVDLSYIAFIMLWYVPSISAFWRVFIINGCWSFFKGFLCIYWDDHTVFIFNFVNVVCHVDWFVDLKESLHPWDKAQLVVMYGLFHILLDSVC